MSLLLGRAILLSACLFRSHGIMTFTYLGDGIAMKQLVRAVFVGDVAMGWLISAGTPTPPRPNCLARQKFRCGDDGLGRRLGATSFLVCEDNFVHLHGVQGIQICPNTVTK
ncbi:hypothetical protein GGI42DRAFT_301285 [Trichoderma sp. SZMC 28013]